MPRGPCTCCNNAYLNRGPWTPEEDALLMDYIKQRGDKGNWRKVPKAAGLQRCGKSCRLRWLNYLRPDIKRGKFSEDETNLIIQLHALLGNRWSIIAGRVPGRSDNEIKNYWNFHLSKKLLSMGIDPKNHKPLHLLGNHHKLTSSSLTSDISLPTGRFFSFYSRNSSFSSSASSFETTATTTTTTTDDLRSNTSNYSAGSLEEESLESWSKFDQESQRVELESVQESQARDHHQSSWADLDEQAVDQDLLLVDDVMFSVNYNTQVPAGEEAFQQDQSCMLNLDFLDVPFMESDGLLEVLDVL